MSESISETHPQDEQSPLVVLCSCPNISVANALAQHLVEHQMAACVSILPQITSVYRWQGNIEQETESLLIIKSLTNQYQAIEDSIKQRHPYEVPEIIALPITKGSAEYIHWLEQQVSTID